MNQSTFGNRFRLTTWGESHGKALGAVVDGCPAGLSLTEEDIQRFLDRRRPGQGRFSTKRQEGDQVEILSGVFEGRTTGSPISLMIRNTDQRSKDYSSIAGVYRPGHADFCFDAKYGFRDYRGGGRSSGRETAGRVAAGAVAVRLLDSLGIRLLSYTKAIGPVWARSFDPDRIASDPLYMPDEEASARASAYLKTCIQEGDSAGGVIECVISGVFAGIGDPVFGKLDALLAGAMMSIGAVKAVEIGDGIAVSSLKGSEDNDGFFSLGQGEEEAVRMIQKTSNHSGGILGGISDGGDIRLRVHVKPTPSISLPQDTVNRSGENVRIEIKGRHDPVIVPRAVVVVECMAACALADALLLNMTSRLDSVKEFYWNRR